MSDKTKFKVGDIVEAFGVRGEVVEAHDSGAYPVSIHFTPIDCFEWFTENGRLHNWHLKPSLILIERPKKKRKETRTVERWMNIYQGADPDTAYVFTTKEAANCTGIYRIACVKLTGTYEIEVDDE